MSLATPTTQQISDNIVAQLESALNQSIPLLPKSFQRVLAKTIAGVFVLIYKYGNFMLLQQFVQTASDQDIVVLGQTINPLKFFGRQVGVGDPDGATYAEMIITVLVTSQGGILPSGTQVVNSDNGVTYLTVGAAALDSPTVQVTIVAASDQSGGGGAGAIGNLQAGDVVSFANPLGNVAKESFILSQTVTGANGEGTDAYRQRILDRFQKRPQGGAYADYEQWAEEVPGIINAYPYTGGPGQVNIYTEATVSSSNSADGIPTNAQLLAVLESINLNENGRAGRRNINAFPNSLPITRIGFNIQVQGITGVNNLPAVQADITSAMSEYLFSVEPFIPGLSIPPRTDRVTSTRVSSIVEDIVTAAGGTFNTATFDVGALTIPDYNLNEGQKAKSLGVAFS